MSFRCVLGRTSIFQEVPLDEALLYGSEDSDFTFRVAKLNPPVRVVPIDLLPMHRGAAAGARYSAVERQRLKVSSRMLVGMRRYWDCRWRLLAFASIEFFMSLLGRQPRPRSCYPGQWAALLKRIVGARARCP